jgi:plasmid stabilization system protein ParE
MSGKYNYRITELCQSDIDDALSYMSVQLHNPDAAESMYFKIEKEIDYITRYPYTRADCQYYYISDTRYRHSIIGNYVLVYYVDDENMELRILRFLYGKMDFSDIEME